MLPATGNLISYLAGNKTVVMADLWTILPVGGGAIRFTSFNSKLVVPIASLPGSVLNTVGPTFTFNLGPKFGRSRRSSKVGMQSTEMDFVVFPEQTDLIGTLTWQQYAGSGGFDGALIELDRLFLPQGSDGIIGPINFSLGAIIWFFGRVADLEIGRSKVTIKIKSLFVLLEEQQMPRRIFQSSCTHIFGDAMCGYDRVLGKNALGVATGLGAVNITAQAGSNQNHVVTTFVPSPSTAYDQGTIVATSGANNTSKRAIATLSGGSISLFSPFTFVVSAGDTFQLLPGCPHTITYCNSPLNNLARFGGFPYIPPPENAI